jgi:hypothetical protein
LKFNFAIENYGGFFSLFADLKKIKKNCVPKILGRFFSLGRILKIAKYKIE